MIAWAAVIFAFSSVPSLGPDLGTWDLLLRKAAHLVEYAILGALLARATRSPLVAVALAGLYAVSDEVHQTFVEGGSARPSTSRSTRSAQRSGYWPALVSQAAGETVPPPRLTIWNDSIFPTDNSTRSSSASTGSPSSSSGSTSGWRRARRSSR